MLGKLVFPLLVGNRHHMQVGIFLLKLLDALLMQRFFTTSLPYFVMAWVTQLTSPLVTAILAPLQCIATAIASYFILHQSLGITDLIGGICVVCGLFSTLFAQYREGTFSESCVENGKLVQAGVVN